MTNKQKIHVLKLKALELTLSMIEIFDQLNDAVGTDQADEIITLAKTISKQKLINL